MWHSGSQNNGGIKYEIRQLALFISFLGNEITRLEHDWGMSLPKEAEYSSHYCRFLNGVTNGEYIFAAYEILQEMLSDKPATPAPLFKQAIMGSILDCAKTDFLDRRRDGYFERETASEAWALWQLCRENERAPIRTDQQDEPAAPPALEEISEEKWERIFRSIGDEFLGERDWELDIIDNFALQEQQPYWPSFQEYRTAKTWLSWAHEMTKCRETKNGN